LRSKIPTKNSLVEVVLVGRLPRWYVVAAGFKVDESMNPIKREMEVSDIVIPNGPAEDGTRGLLKACDSKNTKPGSPVNC
jgi:6-phosphogluconate dehydrogenase